MYKAIHLSPMIPSYDIGATTAFFRDLLGFVVLRDDGSYVILQKDETTIHILRAGADIGEMEFYLEVDKVDAIWERIKDQLAGAKAPFNREYGMREIHVIVPHTKTLLFIGQVIASR